MRIQRRSVLGGVAAAGLMRPAFAQSEPIRIGWLASLTGPASAPAIGFDRGVQFATETIRTTRLKNQNVGDAKFRPIGTP